MRQQIGMILQLIVLVLLPMMLFFDHDFGIKRLVVMPALLIICVAMFFIGHKLRESGQ